MMKTNEFVKHSTIYGIGQVLTRLASILLLPLYTVALTPEQYGVTAILNLGGALLAPLLADGVAKAIVRFHFDDEDPLQCDRVWWTGLAYITVATIVRPDRCCCSETSWASSCAATLFLRLKPATLSC
ncbi:MAG TPA: hypothetical protein EYQ63_24450 [Fuerstia sp.]|nr:hypothetical protein [Fuerstiella sp.]